MWRGQGKRLYEQLQLVAELVGDRGGGRHLLAYDGAEQNNMRNTTDAVQLQLQRAIKPSPLGSGDDMTEEALTATDTTLLGGSSGT